MAPTHATMPADRDPEPLPQVTFGRADELLNQAAELRVEADKLRTRADKLDITARELDQSATKLQAIAREDRDHVQEELDCTLKYHDVVLKDFMRLRENKKFVEDLKISVEEGGAYVQEVVNLGERLLKFRTGETDVDSEFEDENEMGLNNHYNTNQVGETDIESHHATDQDSETTTSKANELSQPAGLVITNDTVTDDGTATTFDGDSGGKGNEEATPLTNNDSVLSNGFVTMDKLDTNAGCPTIFTVADSKEGDSLDHGASTSRLKTSRRRKRRKSRIEDSEVAGPLPPAVRAPAANTTLQLSTAQQDLMRDIETPTRDRASLAVTVSSADNSVPSSALPDRKRPYSKRTQRAYEAAAARSASTTIESPNWNAKLLKRKIAYDDGSSDIASPTKKRLKIQSSAMKELMRQVDNINETPKEQKKKLKKKLKREVEKMEPSDRAMKG